MAEIEEALSRANTRMVLPTVWPPTTEAVADATGTVLAGAEMAVAVSVGVVDAMTMASDTTSIDVAAAVSLRVLEVELSKVLLVERLEERLADRERVSDDAVELELGADVIEDEASTVALELEEEKDEAEADASELATRALVASPVSIDPVLEELDDEYEEVAEIEGVTESEDADASCDDEEAVSADVMAAEAADVDGVASVRPEEVGTGVQAQTVVADKEV